MPVCDDVLQDRQPLLDAYRVAKAVQSCVDGGVVQITGTKPCDLCPDFAGQSRGKAEVCLAVVVLPADREPTSRA